jgi:hypothetical protein
VKALFHESQLAEIDFRKAIKGDVYKNKGEVDSLGRMTNDRMTEVERRLRLTESFYKEVASN